MQDINVAIIQTKLEWENIDANLAHFDKLLSQITTPSDLIILPEMFNTAFSMKPYVCAEKPDGKSMNWLKLKAKEKNCIVVGSILTDDNGKFYNRLVWISPDGAELHYDKKHLFRFAGEQEVFSAGNKKITPTLKSWNFRPLVCYDLRFPVWSTNTLKRGKFEYDCLIYIANWPERRSKAWMTLLIARAMENQAYVIGVNRIGADNNGVVHSGDSMIIDPAGKVLVQCKAHKETIETAVLSAKELNSWRKTFPVSLDWDNFTIQD